MCRFAAETIKCVVDSTGECSHDKQEEMNKTLGHILEKLGDRCLPCASEPCQNGGTCISDEDLEIECICPPDYTGKFCEIGKDEHFLYFLGLLFF